MSTTTGGGLPSYSNNLGHREDDNQYDHEDLSNLQPCHAWSQPAARKSPKTKDFLYTLENRGKPWAILTLTANESLSKNVPTFIEGYPIQGTVKLTLDRPEYIYSVYISVKGEYLIDNAYQGESVIFLDIPHTLWSPAYGGPFNASSTLYSPRNNLPTHFNGPLKGDFSWPFSINLPKEVVAPLQLGHRRLGTFQLPQTFNDHFIRSKIGYTVTLTLQRHGILSVDDKITTSFDYIPIVRPPPFPFLRQLAYQEDTPLLGPTSDPDGWYSLPSLELKAKLFKSREVYVRCTLSLGKPLSYARGTAVPLYLRLESDDGQVLDLLASQKAITARVRRRIKDYVHPGNQLKNFGWRDSLHHSQRAVWWPSTESPDDGSRRLRNLQGEIHLKPGMYPTSALGPFQIEYSIVLFNFESPGLEFPERQFLQEQRIEIATACAPGLRPKAHTSAVYEPDTQFPRQSQEDSFGFY